MRDKRLPWIASGNGNPLAFHCNNISYPNFDVISIGTRQAAWDLPMTSSPDNDDFGWQSPLLGRSMFPPHIWDEFKLAIIGIKALSEELGINPNKIIVMGTSFGADTFITLALTPPVSGTGITRYGDTTPLCDAIDNRESVSDDEYTDDVPGIARLRPRRRWW